MKAVYAPLGFAIGASAAALVPRDQCCFGLTASGGVSGQVGQLSDGQNRIAQTGGLDKQSGQYCLNNGQITDGNGRGCILTPPTTQFQCDSGATPTGGFSVSNGNLVYNGNSQFYACPTGDNGGYNIYTTPVANQQGCVTVTLSTGGKCSSSSSSSAPASSVASSSASASSAPASSAPASSAPASSSSASSAPASSAPASSAPASSTPATTAPASPKTSTIYSTHYETITSCGSTVTNCPAESTVTSSTVYQTTSVPAVASSAPASSAPASSAPASSAPASSAPASSAPASSAPASSAPASSAPASSAPASSAPASSTPASSAPASSAPATSAPATSAAVSSSAPASSTQATSASGSGCATALTGAYQTPHAIIPINSASPDQSYGTQYFAYIGSGNSTIFNFDIPQSYSGKQCSVIFLFPEQKDLETSSFTTSGSGSLTFSSLSSAANLNVTYNTAPKVASQIGEVNNVTPGNSYSVATGSCAAGTTESIEVSASSGYSLEFFEDWNPSPIGVFITSC